MPPFRFKDLVVDVFDASDVDLEFCANTCHGISHLCRFPTCLGHTCFLGTCRAQTFVACRFGTRHLTTIFECTGSACGGSVVDPTLVEQPQDLGVLKQQLQAQLKQVEELEKQQAEAARPQTLAQAEDLEKKLRGALDELQTIKKGLKK